jgi:hypothetical protein
MLGFAFWKVDVLHADRSGWSLPHFPGVDYQIFVFLFLLRMLVVYMSVYGCQRSVAFTAMAFKGAILFLLVVLL